MQTAEYDHSAFDQSNQSREDDKLLVKFFLKSVEDKAETRAQGRPIFKDVEYIDIKIVGNRNTGVCRPASHADKQRFARHYDAFKQRLEPPVEGTPLIEWSLISRSMAEQLAFFNVKTVEQLVAMSDTNARQFMGINNLKAKAKEWLEMAHETAEAQKLHDELEKRDNRISELEAKLNAVLEMQNSDKPLASELDTKPVTTPRRKRAVKKDDTSDGKVQDSE